MTFYIALTVVVLLAIVFLKTKPSSKNISTTKDIITDNDILEKLKEGRKIEAIKLYRELHKVGLKEAKEAIDKML